MVDFELFKRIFREDLPPFLALKKTKKGGITKMTLKRIIFAIRKKEGFTLLFAGIFNLRFYGGVEGNSILEVVPPGNFRKIRVNLEFFEIGQSSTLILQPSFLRI